MANESKDEEILKENTDTGQPDTEEKVTDDNDPVTDEEKSETGENKEPSGEGSENRDPGDKETEDKDPEDKGSEDKADAGTKADKKKKRTDKKTDALQTKIDELEDRVKRQMAEFDNFRKRTEKEKSAMFETGAKSVIEKILPVVDNFERGLATVPEEDAGSPFANGMNMIYKQLIDELDKMEVKPIEAVGCEFDPELHNAVMQVESDEYESGVIAQELQKGYTYRGTVVRHSMVAVVS
ncbi:MAG: nucleotide exchange factor GrpE [Lachnospiraceae bacterium]|nr:nucleotide exchange factor GrpE [Lachnospiraceae bacterium]